MSTIPSPVNGHDLHTGKVDEQPIPYVLTDAAEREPRIVPALVNGAKAYIECPAWCTRDHVAASVVFLADVFHASDCIVVSAPVGINGRTEDIVEACISSYPFTDDPAAYLRFDACGDGECAELTASSALAFADQLVAHAAKLRRLVEQMPEVRS